MKSLLCLAVAAGLWSSSATAESLRVVATIKPIHSLVSSVMGDLGTPDLLVHGGASPHTYSLRPSDAGALENADLVFWTGHGMELFLEDALGSLAGDATVVELADAPGIELLAVREGGAFEEHDHDDEAHGDHEDERETHGHEGASDMHYWLDPDNAALMVAAIADSLSSADPENAATYAANAEAEVARLRALTSEIDAQLAPVKEVPFVVFHDAYQYFERRFGLAVAGTITVTPDTMPGAARVAEIRARLNELDAACVFAEPQFEPAIVETVVEGTRANIGVLDPEGSILAEGPELYSALIRNLSAALSDCLGAE